MKKITCEMCGSTDLIKKDGIFECQSCGTKYSVEEAKKMMVEGTVDVSGSKVKVDDSDKLENYLMMAQHAYDSNNYSEAENYCNKIIEIEPKNYKAWLLKGKSAGWQSTLRKLRLDEAATAFNLAIDNAPEEDLENVKNETGSEIQKLSMALMNLCCNNFARYPSKENAKEILEYTLEVQLRFFIFAKKFNMNLDDFQEELASKINVAVVSAWEDCVLKEYKSDNYPSKYVWERFQKQCFLCIHLTEHAISLSDKDDEKDVLRYENLITYKKALINSCSWTYSAYSGGYVREYGLKDEAKEANIDDIMKYHEKIKEINPDYEIPERPSIYKPATNVTGGCYVATCVYGSYDCPEVWTLRRYRDYYLDEHILGKIFIKVYYAISPKIVKIFGGNRIFININKFILDNWVKKLNNKGYENTKYNDKY